MAPDDKILFVQTLSKNWAMTGWRVGWLEAPPALGADDREYRPVHHVGRSGLHASAPRSPRSTRASRSSPIRSRGCARRATSSATDWRRPGRVRFATPDATFYLFCAVDGEPDSRALALRLVDEAGVGAAPGSAFGPGGEGYLRLCFARAPDEIAEATRRLARWLAR